MRELLIRLVLGIARRLIVGSSVNPGEEERHPEKRLAIPKSAPVRVRITIGDKEYVLESGNLFDDFVLMQVDKLCDAGVADWRDVESQGISYEIESLSPGGGETAD